MLITVYESYIKVPKLYFIKVYHCSCTDNPIKIQPNASKTISDDNIIIQQLYTRNTPLLLFIAIIKLIMKTLSYQ